MLRLKVLYFLFVLVFLNQTSNSQTYNFKNYNTEHGLPQSQVLSIFQDSKGYVWFGTNSGGVAKFDGNKFHTLNSNDGLINDVVFSVLEGSNGNMFFGTSKGLSVYNHFEFKNFDEKNGHKNPWIYKLAFDESKVWIGTQKGVFIYENGKIIQFDKNEALNSSTVYTILIDKKGNIWFGTFQNGVIFYDKSKNSFQQFSLEQGMLSEFIFSFYERKDGSVLVGTRTGLNTINSDFKVSEVSAIPSNTNNSYSCIAPLSDTEYFFGSFSFGIFSFDFKGNKPTGSYNSRNGLTNNPIISMIKDREGNIWIGTDGAGVFKFVNHKFMYYTKANGLLDNYVNAVGEDIDGNLWLALSSNGLARINKQDVVSFKAKTAGGKNQLPDNNINTILADKDGKVYFGTNEGLCYFLNDKFTIFQDEKIRSKYVYCLHKDSKGDLWIGTNEGVFVLSDNIIKPITKVNSNTEDGFHLLILFILEDKFGRMVFGTENGILIYDGEKVVRYDNKNGFINSRVICAVLDSKKNLWLGTSEGLFLYNYGVFSKISKKHGYTSGFINFLNIDKNDNLYIGSNNGVDILNIKSFYNNKNELKHLGKDDGLLNLESNANASFISKDGRILIGTIKGLEIYNPKLDFKNKLEPSLLISDVKLFYGQEDIMPYTSGVDSISLLPKNLILSYTKNNLTFKYIGISLLAPEKVMYKYMLKGLDETWTPDVSKNEVTYPSLPPGTYTFMVKSMNNDGVWNENAASFAFEILPPWYKTAWFYTICALSLAGGVISYNYLKTRKLKADKQKLERVVNERTRELREEKEKVEIINKEVIEQKAEIENKNHEITDSIKYAKNIQEALLPALEETERAFENCFILYLPKDIVSGDFFWFSGHNGKRFIAAADCTGHGVPGAFMSIVGNNLLNEIINQRNITNPGNVLLELHKGVKKALHQNSNDNNERRDGMDIALCSINENSDTIEFSGANRPLWIFRKDKNYELEVIKPNKFPIGGLELEEQRSYEAHSVNTTKGDTMYIFSDGFADQFGGPRGKKFMVSNMQKLLKENIHLSMNDQKELIHQTFKLWKNNLEQVDDVCIIGIRL